MTKIREGELYFMFVFTFKASTLKYIGVMSLCAVAIVLTVAIVPSESLTVGVDNRVVEVSARRKAGDFKNVTTNADRISFLESYGWEVSETPVLESAVTIPEEFDEVYEEYNALQKSEGLDLAKYKGKIVETYVYRVNNAEEDAFANLLIYKGCVVGGDVSSASPDGFIYGFSGEVIK